MVGPRRFGSLWRRLGGCSLVSFLLNVYRSLDQTILHLQPEKRRCQDVSHRGRRANQSLSTVKQDSKMLSSDAANIIFSARRRIGCATQDAFAHLKTVSCDACLRTIHWWNRRVRLVDSQLVHLSCWKGQLFFKALVADHIRYVQVMAHDSSASSRNHLHE